MTPAARVAGRLRITEGQVYTVTTSLALALLLLGLGLPSLRDVAPQFTDDQVLTTPLALSGSPAVADVIVAAAPAPPPDVLVEIESAAEFVGAPPAPSFTTPPRISVEEPPTTATRAVETPAADPDRSSNPSEAPTTEPPAPTALRITEARYATASGPLVPSGAPGAFLPVGLRLGAPDKQSYLRLTGSGTTLELKLSTEPTHQFGEVNAVRACRIIPAAWTIADGSPLSAAPEVDPIDCTLGRPGPTGYTFELGGVDIRNGIALVPSGPSTGTFQVTFRGGAS
ncbi:MAG: hypothetical protein M3Q68_02775 [Actinomycetota bacterium]|nr:hypothetical protein [Actinomycetota bacterium]